MKQSVLLHLFFTMFIATIADAQIYKCVSEDGIATYSDTPCSKDAEKLYDPLPNYSLDEAIGMAIPFAQLTVDSKNVHDDLLVHAQKIGRSILPDGRYKSHFRQGANREAGRFTKWKITLRYGPKEKTKWKIVVVYKAEKRGDVSGIWIKTIYTYLDGKYSDPPSINRATRLNKIRTGEWQVK